MKSQEVSPQEEEALKVREADDVTLYRLILSCAHVPSCRHAGPVKCILIFRLYSDQAYHCSLVVYMQPEIGYRCHVPTHQ